MSNSFATSWTVDHQAPLSMEFSKNTGVGSQSLLQGIFLTQGSNLSLLHCRQILYHLSHKGGPDNRITSLRTNPLSSGKTNSTQGMGSKEAPSDFRIRDGSRDKMTFGSS